MPNQNPLSAILSYMPPRIRPALERTEPAFSPSVHEIALRADRPLCIYCADQRYYVDENGLLSDDLARVKALCVTQAELQDTLMKLCDYSVYAHQDELAHGYLNASGGLRVGVCGSAVIKGGRVVNFAHISTLSFRVPREVLGCGKTLLSLIEPKGGALICGAPCSGKTTLIRDLARELSYRCKVSVMDERGELSGGSAGGFGYDLGLCDVYIGAPKGYALMCAVRSMAPDIVVCDELGDGEDVASVRYALRCGAACIATVHAASLNDLRNRPAARELLSSGAFRYLVFLSERRFSGSISRIYEWSAADA